jgi:hypothetical protein
LLSGNEKLNLTGFGRFISNPNSKSRDVRQAVEKPLRTQAFRLVRIRGVLLKAGAAKRIALIQPARWTRNVI